MTGSARSARFTATFTILLAFFVALLFPVGYFAISYQYAEGSLEAEAEVNAQIVASVIQSNPEYWRFEHARLEALLSRRPHAGHAEVRRLLDLQGREIAANGDDLEPPIIRRTQPLMDAGNVVAKIEISRSLMPIVKQAALLAVLGLGIGMLVFILLPLKAIGLANAKLRDSHDFLTRVMESSTNAIIVLDRTGTIEMVNGRCAEIMGYAAERLSGASIAELFHGCSLARVQWELGQVSSGEEEMVKFETDLLKSDGSIVPIACGAAPIYQNGHIGGTVLSIEDIAERKQAVEQLRQAKEYTENLIQAASVMIVGLDRKGVVTLINGTAEEVTGYRAADLIGRSWFGMVMAEEAFHHMCRLAAPDTESARNSFEHEIATKSGAIRIISWRNSPITENGKVVGTLCFGIDITEHKKIEAQLRQSQKMESIGQLAGGVAHDFNNMLSVILGYAQLCQLEVPRGSTQWQYIEEICRAGERSKDMVRQLLAFSRQEIISPRAINLNAHYIETERTLSRLLGEEIRLSFLPSTGLWTVKIDPYQADQILINLAVNARDAMPAGGEVIIETENVMIGEEFCEFRLDATPGEFICLTVSDTGTGMDKELVKRIFEPFFTTKEVGKGTGLGLATVYGIVTQNGGFIDVESEPGVGTSFRIYLPRLPEETENVAEESREALTGTGSILVVEDDASIRSVATQMLEKIGYTVIPAETPQHALSLCRDPEVPIDLVLSDVVMPEMNGKEMAQVIATLRPDTKILFMSGYSSDIIGQRGILENGMHYIQKPLEMEALHQKIRELREMREIHPSSEVLEPRFL